MTVIDSALWTGRRGPINWPTIWPLDLRLMSLRMDMLEM